MRSLSLIPKAIGVILGSVWVSLAYAGGVVTGTVQQVLVRASDGLVYTVINGSASGQPSCATHTYWIIMNETSDAGHKQYALLLQAQASGARVTIYGNGTCTRWGDGEDIDSILVTTQ